MKTLLLIICISSSGCALTVNPDGSVSASVTPEGAKYIVDKYGSK